MGGSVKQIVISGYYGFRNSGDEAVLQSILLALEAASQEQGVAIEPVVLSGDPAMTSRMYGVPSVHRMKPGEVIGAIRKSSGLISGGGSLLQDATGWKTIPYYLAILKLAQWFRKPTFVYSQGLGPVNRSSFFNPIVQTFSRCGYVSVRDTESANLLSKMGYTKTVEVVPDPVMGLPLRSSGAAVDVHGIAAGDASLPVTAAGKASNYRNEIPVIGVSVRYWNKDRSDLAGIAASLELIMRQYGGEAVIRFLPFHLPLDLAASEDVMDRLKSSGCGGTLELVRNVEHPQDMLREVASCDLLIGMRLHSLIYGASQLVPVVAISYDPKIDHFMRRLDTEAVTSTSDFQTSAVANEAIRLLQAGPEWHAARAKRVEALKKEAQRPAQQIVALLRQ